MKKWLAEGKPTASGAQEPGDGLAADGDYNYHVVNENIFVRDIATVHQSARQIFTGAKDIQILDARPNVQTYGGTPGRPGFLSGNITGSKCLFAQSLVNQDNGTMKSDDEIKAVRFVFIS